MDQGTCEPVLTLPGMATVSTVYKAPSGTPVLYGAKRIPAPWRPSPLIQDKLSPHSVLPRSRQEIGSGNSLGSSGV